MALPMPCPWRDPQTQIFYPRKRVPKDLVRQIGRGWYKVSLGAKEAALAKTRFADALAKAEWEAVIPNEPNWRAIGG